MTDFSYGDYVSFNYIGETTGSHHEILIRNICPYITRIIPRMLWMKYLIKFPSMYIEKYFFHGYKTLFTLLQNCQKLMSGTKKVR